MSRSVIETVLGGMVLIGAIIFLVFSYSKGDAGDVSGYHISANFSKIGGLKSGDPVLISGVKIGQIADVTLDPKTYLAKVNMEIDNDIKIPDDSAATISSLSLLGGMVLGIEPGGSEEMLTSGGEIQYTQAPQNLEELLGKFIFSMQDKSKETSSAAPSNPPEAKGLVLQPANPVGSDIGISESP
jgi:phospholipid/cholesterol/gamma-HCH transport system substrate-binding protein